MNKGNGEPEESFSGPRAILRVPEVLMALAHDSGGRSFADLSEAVGLPKSSLHRMLRTLEGGGYVINTHGTYRLGPGASRLAQMIERALPPQGLAAIAKPILEDVAQRSGESVILAVLHEQRSHVIYVEVINSNAPLRVMVPRGNIRPLHSASSGKAILAYMTAEDQRRYVSEAPFEMFTDETSTREELPEILQQIRRSGVVFDRNGSFRGASGVAVPCFDSTSEVCAALSVAGPTDRIERHRAELEARALEAGERISRSLGYLGPYPKPTAEEFNQTTIRRS